MNYRHGYHAGNHTEVFKHAALIALIDLFKQKERPFMVLDTHAGVGIHDLTSEMAQRTGEATGGIRRVLASTEAALQPYLSLIRSCAGADLAFYPGSPEITRRLLRRDDRLIACELHSADAAALRRNLAGDPRVALHNRDGYDAVLAFVPPRERRGLVFIDPPFEKPDEVTTLAQCLLAGHKKWPTGTFVAWFPVKDFRIAVELTQAMQDARIAKTLLATFIPHRMDGNLLAGSGLVVISPPWTLKERLEAICIALGQTYAGSRWTVGWITGEDGSPSMNPVA